MLSNELPDAFSVHKVSALAERFGRSGYRRARCAARWMEQARKGDARSAAGASQSEDREIQTRLFGRKRETTLYLSRGGFECAAGSAERVERLRDENQTIEFHEVYVPIEAIPELIDHVRRYIPAYAYQLARGDKGFAAYINLGEGRFIQGAGRILKAGYVITIDYGANWDGVRRSNSITSEPTGREPAGSGPIRIIRPRSTTSRPMSISAIWLKREARGAAPCVLRSATYSADGHADPS